MNSLLRDAAPFPRGPILDEGDRKHLLPRKGTNEMDVMCSQADQIRNGSLRKKRKPDQTN